MDATTDRATLAQRIWMRHARFAAAGARAQRLARRIDRLSGDRLPLSAAGQRRELPQAAAIQTQTQRWSGLPLVQPFVFTGGSSAPTHALQRMPEAGGRGVGPGAAASPGSQPSIVTTQRVTTAQRDVPPVIRGRASVGATSRNIRVLAVQRPTAPTPAMLHHRVETAPLRRASVANTPSQSTAGAVQRFATRKAAPLPSDANHLGTAILRRHLAASTEQIMRRAATGSPPQGSAWTSMPHSPASPWPGLQRQIEANPAARRPTAPPAVLTDTRAAATAALPPGPAISVRSNTAPQYQTLQREASSAEPVGRPLPRGRNMPLISPLTPHVVQRLYAIPSMWDTANHTPGQIMRRTAAGSPPQGSALASTSHSPAFPWLRVQRQTEANPATRRSNAPPAAAPHTPARAVPLAASAHDPIQLSPLPLVTPVGQERTALLQTQAERQPLPSTAPSMAPAAGAPQPLIGPQTQSIPSLEQSGPGQMALDDLTDKVWRKLMRRLAVESERRGWRQWT